MLQEAPMSHRSYIFRRAEGKLRKSLYTLKILDLINSSDDFNFLSLEESDTIMMHPFNDMVFFHKTKDQIAIFKWLKMLSGGYYMFIDHDWEYCGAIYIETLSVLLDTFRFGKKITDDIVLVSKDYSVRIELDYYEEFSSFYIDLRVYGDLDYCTVLISTLELR